MKSKRTLVRVLTFALTSSLVVSSLTAAVFAKNYENLTAVRSNSATRITGAQYSTPRRRPRTYDVEHYVIRTRFDVPNKTVIGEVDITLKPLAGDFRDFELDAANLIVGRVSLTSGSLASEKLLRFVVRPATLRVILDRAYLPSESITVKIKYRTQPKRGIYFISPSRQGRYQKPAQIWSQGEPEDNHHWFPCYDFPDDKATSEQYITTGANQLAIANGSLVETTTNPNGTRTFHWEMDKVHSSYLISLVVGDFAKLVDSHNDVALEYYTYHGTEQMAHRAFDVTPTMIGWFSRALAVDFPYNRYAQTVVADFIFGGMENITATTFADSEILIGDDEGSGSETINLVSHELAHSWFGDLVTCKDWSNLWLNEGFATFLEAAYREGQGGREAYLFELQADAKSYFDEDPSINHHPLVNPNYPLSMDLFDATTYKKGAYVVHMLRETVGDKVFWKALNIYLNEFKYQNVDSRDLQRVFERVSGQSLGWFFEQWVFKAGYPKLVVASQYNPSARRLTLTVTQTQKGDQITPSVFRLPMELEIVTESGTRIEQIEINRRTQNFSFEVDDRPLSVTFDKRASVLKKLSANQLRTVMSIPILDGADIQSDSRASGAFDKVKAPTGDFDNHRDIKAFWPLISSLPFSPTAFTRFGIDLGRNGP